MYLKNSGKSLYIHYSSAGKIRGNMLFKSIHSNKRDQTRKRKNTNSYIFIFNIIIIISLKVQEVALSLIAAAQFKLIMLTVERGETLGYPNITDYFYDHYIKNKLSFPVKTT